MRNLNTTVATEDLDQREENHQRWADDGGVTPDAVPPETPLALILPDGPFGLPVRRVYHRTTAAQVAQAGHPSPR